jgi:hypothetical protein
MQFAGGSEKLKCKTPGSKPIKNFKMETAEYQSKGRVLLSKYIS